MRAHKGLTLTQVELALDPGNLRLSRREAIQKENKMSIGQETGKTPEAMRDEVVQLVKIISQSSPESLSDKDLHFYEDMKNRLVFPKFVPSGRQLFWLRDIKDKLL